MSPTTRPRPDARAARGRPAGALCAAILSAVCACNQQLHGSRQLPAYSSDRYAGAPAGSHAMPAPAAPVATAHTPREKVIHRDESAKSGRGELDLRVDRLWAENGFTYATVSVRNTSVYELEEITIRCTAFGNGHVNLSFREQTLLTKQDGRMPPGFAKTLKIRLERGGFDVREMSCSARGW